MQLQQRKTARLQLNVKLQILAYDICNYIIFNKSLASVCPKLCDGPTLLLFSVPSLSSLLCPSHPHFPTAKQPPEIHWGGMAEWCNLPQWVCGTSKILLIQKKFQSNFREVQNTDDPNNQNFVSAWNLTGSMPLERVIHVKKVHISWCSASNGVLLSSENMQGWQEYSKNVSAQDRHGVFSKSNNCHWLLAVATTVCSHTRPQLFRMALCGCNAAEQKFIVRILCVEQHLKQPASNSIHSTVWLTTQQMPKINTTNK